jgi:hypothetical protein
VITQIPLANELVPLVLSGKKTSTVRLGIRKYQLGPARIVSGNQGIPIQITGLEFTKVGRLDERVAKSDGYDSLGELLRVLKRFYPSAQIDDDITVIRFRLL